MSPSAQGRPHCRGARDPRRGHLREFGPPSARRPGGLAGFACQSALPGRAGPPRPVSQLVGHSRGWRGGPRTAQVPQAAPGRAGPGTTGQRGARGSAGADGCKRGPGLTREDTNVRRARRHPAALGEPQDPCRRPVPTTLRGEASLPPPNQKGSTNEEPSRLPRADGGAHVLSRRPRSRLPNTVPRRVWPAKCAAPGNASWLTGIRHVAWVSRQGFLTP